MRHPVIWIIIAVYQFTPGLKAQTQNRSEIQLSQNQYFSPSITPGQRAGFSSLGTALSYFDDKKFWTFGFAGNGLLALDGSNENYLAIPDLYTTYKGSSESHLRLTIGRKRELWSEFDSLWKLGLWQPLARWDYLNPQEQGLTGLFVHYEIGDVQLMMFTSGLFIPDQGPNFKLQNGQFTSDNRWFRAPESEFFYRESATRINYQLDTPQLSQVINQFSWGFKGTLGNTTSGAWASLATAIMPLNQFHLAIDPGYSISMRTFSQQGVVVVHPLVISHQVTALEVGFTDDDQRGWVSLTRDIPSRPDVPPSWLQSNLDTVVFAGATYAHNVDIFGFKRSSLQVSALQRWDETSIANNFPSADQVESSLDRFNFSQVLAIGWDMTPMNTAARTLTTHLKYMYSIPDKGGWLSSQVVMGFDRDLQIHCGFDILGADTDLTTGLMGIYRSNSRVSGGLSYVF